MMSERAVEITQSYSPGRKRTVVVEKIPAIELILDDDVEIGLAFGVCERIQVLVRRALRENGAVQQRITYSAKDAFTRAPRGKAASLADASR